MLYVGLYPGFAYIEYENPEDAKAALRHMDGGQIDGQEVTETQCDSVLTSPLPR